MGSYKEFNFKIRSFLTMYRFKKIDPVPNTPLLKPINECTVGLVTTAGLVPPELPDFEEILGGDPSFRIIENTQSLSDLREVHRSDSFDHGPIEADRNIAFPLKRLLELESKGLIGKSAPRHVSFMGSITAPGKLIKKYAPEASRIFVEDKVDLVLLIPI